MNYLRYYHVLEAELPFREYNFPFFVGKKLFPSILRKKYWVLIEEMISFAAVIEKTTEII